VFDPPLLRLEAEASHAYLSVLMHILTYSPQPTTAGPVDPSNSDADGGGAQSGSVVAPTAGQTVACSTSPAAVACNAPARILELCLAILGRFAQVRLLEAARLGLAR
jgi:hypothetical protein